MFHELIVAQVDTTARREAQHNNSARLAFSQHKIQSAGLGSLRRADPLMFDVIFLDEPLFTQGASLIARPVDVSDPLAQVGVYAWERNAKGAYIGAYIYLSVSTGDLFLESVEDGGVRVTHHLLFQGVGFKDLGQEVTTEAQLLTPRTSGFGV